MIMRSRNINNSLYSGRRTRRVLNRRGKKLIAGMLGVTLVLVAGIIKDFSEPKEVMRVNIADAIEYNVVEEDNESTIEIEDTLMRKEKVEDKDSTVDKIAAWNATRKTDIIIRVGEWASDTAIKEGKRVYLLDSQLDSLPDDILIREDEKGKFVHEFDINMKLAKKVYNALLERGISAELQIATSKSQDLNSAGRLSNGSNPRIYLSLHHNAFDKESANGYMFYTNPGDETAANIASYLSDSIKNNGLVEQKPNRINKGNYIGELNVINNSTIGILGEMGYFTNPVEILNICSDEYTDYVSEHLADELVEVLNKFWA